MIIMLKKLIYYITRLSQVILSSFRVDRTNNSIVFYPPFENVDDLSNQYYRMKWYIPKTAYAQIYLTVPKDWKHKNLNKLSLPSYLRDQKQNQLDIVYCSKKELDTMISKSDIICIWKAEGHKWLKKLWFFILKVRIVDPEYYLFSEAHTYPAIFWYDLLSRKTRREWFKDVQRVFKDMTGQYKSCSNSYVFGTGPSSSSILDYSYEDGVRVICNSMVRNEKMLSHIQPSICVFIDSVFHFGASKYAERFLSDLLEMYDEYKPYIVSNIIGYALIRAHYPKLQGKFLALPAKRFGKPVILSKDSFFTRDYPNVLTRCMLPIAAGLSNKIILIGFDGRNPDENYFWQHNPNIQYVSKMDSTKLAHPSFFNNIDYDRYYDRHCLVVDKLVKVFEQEGKNIASWTKSYIPALSRRYEKPKL